MLVETLEGQPQGMVMKPSTMSWGVGQTFVVFGQWGSVFVAIMVGQVVEEDLAWTRGVRRRLGVVSGDFVGRVSRVST